MSYLALERVLELVELGKNCHSAYEVLVKKKRLTYSKAKYFGQQRLYMVQDFHIFSSEGLFLYSTLLRISRQGVSNSICFALTVIDLEVVMRKFLSLADLSGAQILRVYELSKVVMVGKHNDFMLKAF